LIFLDMDGVLCDFIGPAAALHGRDARALDWAAGKGLDLAAQTSKVFGLGLDAFWWPIHAAGEKFWAELELTPWASGRAGLVASALRLDDCVVLSRPSSCPTSAAGKALWLRRHFDGRFAVPSGAILCARKELLAGPGRVLIDDDDRNVAAWRAAGGAAVLLPQPWNAAGDQYFSADPAAVLRVVREQLDELYTMGRP
jgi:hypothetical protein